MLLDPGLLDRDSRAKYAAAFLTISKSSLVLASSRRRRPCSASRSDDERFTGELLQVASSSLPARLNRIQCPQLDPGIVNRLAAGLPPIDSAKRTASTLNSVVYCRFGANVFLLINPPFIRKLTAF